MRAAFKPESVGLKITLCDAAGMKLIQQTIKFPPAPKAFFTQKYGLRHAAWGRIQIAEMKFHPAVSVDSKGAGLSICTQNLYRPSRLGDVLDLDRLQPYLVFLHLISIPGGEVQSLPDRELPFEEFDPCF